MKYISEISEALISSVTLYPESGLMVWNRKPERRSQDYSWNTRNAYQEVGSVNAQGYRQFSIYAAGKSRSVRAHRAAWFLYYGYWPEHEIDHINHIRDDNRIINLRDVTHFENSINKGISSNNNSGYVGVSWSARAMAWVASYQKLGKSVYIGKFSSKEEAAYAICQRRQQAKFHENHGRKYGPLVR